MDINITKEDLNVNKIICEKKEIINVQGDMIVPDSKPDILNTINVSGNICIYKKEIMDGKLRLDGSILTYIMYLADGESDNIRGLNTSLDFSETINIPELTSDMNADTCPNIKNIECKILNGRKIEIKVTIEVNIKISMKQEISIVTNIENENVQILNKNIKLNSLLGEGETKAYVKENISIPATDNLAEILKAQICLVDKDTKISYNKILAKSEIEICLTYLTDEGRICTNRARVPLVGFIDMPNISEEHICDISYCVKNIIIKPNTVEEHSVYVEIEVEISCMVYEEKEINLIEDMYCPGEKMEFQENIFNGITNKQSRKCNCNIREKINIPDIHEGEIIDIEANPSINKENKLRDKIIIEGEIELNIIYRENTGIGINTKKISMPFEQTIDGIDDVEKCKTNTEVEVSSQEFINQGETMSSDINLNLITNSYKNVEIPVISDVTVEEIENLEDYSVIIYVVKSGDTIWKIAKRFGSTVDDIVRVNGIENPNRINIGEKIYIPKYVMIHQNG